MRFSMATVVGFILFSFAAGLVSSSWISFVPSPISDPRVSSENGIDVAFCPSSECTLLPVAALDSANHRIWVAIYSFTNPDFSDALIRAHERGVDVRVIVEKQQAGGQYSKHPELAEAGISVRIDSNPNYMHHKFAVIDEDKLINGSMNWSGNGVRENNENVMVIDSSPLNDLFSSEFQKVWDESDAFGGS